MKVTFCIWPAAKSLLFSVRLQASSAGQLRSQPQLAQVFQAELLQAAVSLAMGTGSAPTGSPAMGSVSWAALLLSRFLHLPCREARSPFQGGKAC